MGQTSKWKIWALTTNAWRTDEFYNLMLRLAGEVAGCACLSAYAFDARLSPILLANESLAGTRVTDQAHSLYMASGMHLHDPLRPYFEPVEGLQIFTLHRADIPDRRYRQQIYEALSLSCRVSMIGQSERGWCMLNVYWMDRSGPVTPAQIVAIHARAPMLFALLSRHLEGQALPTLSGDTAAFLSATLAKIAPHLSERERLSCAHALRGLTNEAIGLELGIAQSTVITLRKRAYSKLGITALNEMFALCLDAIRSQPAPPAPPAMP